MAFVLDFGLGIGVMRIDSSCYVTLGGPADLPVRVCQGPNQLTEQSPLPWGKSTAAARNYMSPYWRGPAQPGGAAVLVLQSAASNAAYWPIGAWALGEIDSTITVRTEPDGNLKATFSIKGFPSFEAYQFVKGRVRTFLRFREQGWNPSDGIDTSPDPSPLKQFQFINHAICTNLALCN